MGFLGGGEGSKITSLELCYKLDIWYVSTHRYVVSENIPFSTKALLILLMPAFLVKNQHILAKIVPLLKAVV